MSPRDFLDVAYTLIAGLDEANWCSAVSRAYYAAFHTARQLLEQCGFDPPRSDVAHTYLWIRLANSGHIDIRNSSSELHNLRQARNRADYDLDRPLNQATSLGHVQLGESIIQLLDLVAADPVLCTRITETMKIYERDVLGQVTWLP